MKLYHKNGGTFGITIYRNRNMNGPLYGDLLVDSVIPELKRTNGGVLDPLIWQQDGTPCHVTNDNLQLLDGEFDGRVVSRRAIRGQEWPPRSPDLNPCDFFLWGYLK